MNWAKGSANILHVSNFNLIPSKRDNSLAVLSDNRGDITKLENYNTAGVDDIDEACWTLLNPAGDKLYVASFGANTISPFDVNSSGNITSQASVATRGGNAPPGDTKDMYITLGDNNIYVLGAFQSFSINRFDISGSVSNYESQYVLKTTSASVGSAGTYNFLGLIGYDL